MGRQPRRRINSHPNYKRGARLRADEVRQARQQQGNVGASAPSLSSPREPRPVARQPVPKTRRWLPRNRYVLFGVPAAVLVIALIVLAPFMLQTWKAYGKIFVGRDSQPRVIVNDQGTPVLDLNGSAPLPDWGKKERVNIALLGSDTSPDRREEGEIPLSDTIIIVSIDPASKQVGLLSIPRDLLVTIPGIGEEKINAAYSSGELSNLTGPGLVKATLEHNFDVPIHYFAEVDFEGFKKIIDTVGGVTLDVPAPIKDDQYPGEKFNYTRVYFHTGLQHVNGQTALRYVRTRHDDNDFARGERQQQLLRALREQAVDLNLISKAPELMAALGDTVRTDLQPLDMLKLAKLGAEIKPGSIHSYSIQSALTEQWSPGQPYYLIPDWTEVRAILKEMMPGADGSAQSSRQVTDLEKPNLKATVLIENATLVDRLAARAAGKLKEQGFTTVTVAQAPDAGQHGNSQVITSDDNLATARLIAKVLGLPPESVIQGDASQTSDNDIVVILGDDAPEGASDVQEPSENDLP